MKLTAIERIIRERAVADDLDAGVCARDISSNSTSETVAVKGYIALVHALVCQEFDHRMSVNTEVGGLNRPSCRPSNPTKVESDHINTKCAGIGLKKLQILF